ncbi:MAG: spore germination protein [Halanaerobiales bacterium]|nr:spore germination protein [Halanaerobiales bacterium]
MAIPIIFNAININSLNTNSLVSIGENAQPDWDSHSKTNQGSGAGFGFNWDIGIINYIFDNDVWDTPIFDPDFVPTVQKQQF